MTAAPLSPRDVAMRHCELLDDHLPGVTRGAYLVGSSTLGDHRPGVSDVDTVTVTTRELNVADHDALRAVHACLTPDSVGAAYDTTYVPARWLTAPPVADSVTPFSLDGELHLDEPAFQVNPTTWLELTCAVVVRGPSPATLDIADVSDALQAWTVDNLRTYWADTAAQMRRVLVPRPANQEASGEVVVWHVLGAPRLHATLTTGQVISKTDAGDYAARRWPQFADLAYRCMAWRAGQPVAFTTVDGLAAADLVDEVVADALVVTT